MIFDYKSSGAPAPNLRTEPLPTAEAARQMSLAEKDEVEGDEDGGWSDSSADTDEEGVDERDIEVVTRKVRVRGARERRPLHDFVAAAASCTKLPCRFATVVHANRLLLLLVVVITTPTTVVVYFFPVSIDPP